MIFEFYEAVIKELDQRKKLLWFVWVIVYLYTIIDVKKSFFTRVLFLSSDGCIKK